MRKTPIQTKSLHYAKRVVTIYKSLMYDKKEFILSRQFLKSGTSIGANIEEAVGSQSRKQFISKMYISYREARESRYWITLLKDGDYINKNIYKELMIDANELCKLIGTAIKTAKSNTP